MFDTRPTLWLAAVDADAFITDPNHPEFLGECPDCGCYLSVSFGELVCRHCEKEEREAWEYMWHMQGVADEMLAKASAFCGMPLCRGEVVSDVDLFITDADVKRYDFICDADRYGEEFMGATPGEEMLCLATVPVAHEEFVPGVTTFATVAGW